MKKLSTFILFFSLALFANQAFATPEARGHTYQSEKFGSTATRIEVTAMPSPTTIEFTDPEKAYLKKEKTDHNVY